jgi:hypothetical protein
MSLAPVVSYPYDKPAPIANPRGHSLPQNHQRYQQVEAFNVQVSGSSMLEPLENNAGLPGDNGNMGRRRRIAIPRQPHHVILRGNNRRRLFSCPVDYRFFPGFLKG